MNETQIRNAARILFRALNEQLRRLELLAGDRPVHEWRDEDLRAVLDRAITLCIEEGYPGTLAVLHRLQSGVAATEQR